MVRFVIIAVILLLAGFLTGCGPTYSDYERYHKACCDGYKEYVLGDPDAKGYCVDVTYEEYRSGEAGCAFRVTE